MMLSLAFIAHLLSTAVAVDISAVGSSATLLFQNNLNYTDDLNHIGAILLDPLPYDNATYACAALGETLLSVEAAQAHSEDISPQLAYLAYTSQYRAGQPFWVSGGSAIQGSGSNLSITTPNSGSHLPVLCSQSANSTNDVNGMVPAYTLLSVASSSNTFVGYRDLKSFRFLGIPYADPTPRWRYPNLITAQGTTFNATAFGPECYQTGSGLMSEQCQYLNIYTPYVPSSGSSSGLRPVMIWIHGGAYTSGSGADPTTDGGNMASRGDIVVVTINYRLSTLGFLALPGTNITGNYGIADSIIALQWIQRNIAAFGGDPNEVTIYGQSAGAGAVRTLLGSPKAIGLFSAAVPGSNLDGLDYAATYSNYYTVQDEATVVGNLIVNATNCTNTDSDAVVGCLLAFNATELVNMPNVARFVVVDGTYVTTPELEVTGNGPAAYVPTLWGTMADDGAAFIGYPNASINASVAIQTLNFLSANLTQQIVESGLFPIPNTGNQTLDLYNVSARVATNIQFRCKDQATVYSAIKHNVFPVAYYYQFNRAYQGSGYDPNAPVCDAPKTAEFPHGDPNQPYFRCHSGDLYFEFGTFGQFNIPYRDANDLVFNQLIMDHWTSFFRSYNPNPDPGYLNARGYTTSYKIMQQTGYWSPVTSTSSTLRQLDVTPVQTGFLEVPQCALLGFPLDFYEAEQA